MVFTKPILTWIGNKSQCLEQILHHFPKEMNNYYEPFLGGGSVLLGLLDYISQDKIVVKNKIRASDSNKVLVGFYNNLQKNPKKIIYCLEKIIKKYNQISGDSEYNDTKRQLHKQYYLNLRNEFNEIKNKNSIKCSALLIFLNKTCFSGIYRESKIGFNGSFGYKRKINIDSNHLYTVSKLIQPVEFECLEYEASLNRAKSGDYIYLDPPYVTKDNKKNEFYAFSNFNDSVFFDYIKKIKERGIHWSHSNRDCKTVIDAFPQEQYGVYSIRMDRFRSGSDRYISELLITTT